MTRRFYLNDLIGRLVHDADGAPVGRIFDVRAEETDGNLEVVEFHLGADAALERLGVSLLRTVGVHRATLKKIPWDRLDLSDVERPVLLP
jgi:hypothetical protein